MKKKTIYEVVKASDELPEKDAWYFIELETGQKVKAWYVSEFRRFDDERNYSFYYYEVKHWLKQSEKYVFDDEGLIEFARELFEAGRRHEYHSQFGTVNPAPQTVEEFLLTKGISVKPKFIPHHY